MADNQKNQRGGSSEQHAEAGRQSHKNQDGNQGGNQGSGKQGFASMDEDKQREIAAMGGRASHGGNDDDNEGGMRGGSREQHREAGRKGGEA